MDISGYAWSLAAGLLGAVVNVATTYIAAKATGQDYTWKDALVAAGTGAANAISPWFSGLGSGLYAYVTAKEKGVSNNEALVTGLVSGICTTMSMSNIANHFVPDLVTLAESTVLDLTYGTGANIISASVNRVIMDKVEAKTSAGSGKRLIKKATAVRGMQSVSRYRVSIAYKQ